MGWFTAALKSVPMLVSAAESVRSFFTGKPREVAVEDPDAARAGAAAGAAAHAASKKAGNLGTCQLPPNGWHCTRTAGHTGPCAALPDD